MTIPRQEALLLVGVLLVGGLALTLGRLIRARRHGISLRLQIFLALSITAVVPMAVFALIVIDRFEARAVLFARQAAEDDARVVSALTRRAMSLFGMSLADGAAGLKASGALFRFTSGPDDTRVELLSARGEILFDTASGGPEADVAARPEVRAALAGRIDGVAHAAGRGRIAAATPIVKDGEVVGVARIVKSTFGMQEVLSDVAPKVVLLALLLAGVSALAALVIGRSVGQPMERLTHAARRIAAGERQAALPVPRGREVRALTQAFESMRGELEQRSAVESLAVDLSHELKNPVAAIRAAAEVLEDAVVHDPQAAARFARRIAESAVKLDALLGDLLALARLEAKGVAASVAPLDLVGVAEEAVAGVSEAARVGGVGLELESPGPLWVRGDRVWLGRAVENLLANAVAYSPAGGAVRVRLSLTGHEIDLLVTDSGPGIEPSIAGRVFERFVTTRQGEGGTGLGLAIVRAVAEAHGGRAEVRASGTGGTTMALCLPRA